MGLSGTIWIRAVNLRYHCYTCIPEKLLRDQLPSTDYNRVLADPGPTPRAPNKPSLVSFQVLDLNTNGMTKDLGRQLAEQPRLVVLGKLLKDSVDTLALRISDSS